MDDEENYAEMLQDLLRNQNYRVDMATRPERAIDQLEQIPYDLVISDYKMPVMDGADFLKRARELYPNLPFILVSGLVNTPELVKVANMSVTLVMEKPLNTAEFLRQVARFSTPMTEEEKAQIASDSEVGTDQLSMASYNYPEEPRFFSAGCSVSRRFMQEAWHMCKQGSFAFFLEPCGGDGELVAKDLSAWRGNGDKPLTQMTCDEFIKDGAAHLAGLGADSETSRLLLVRLDTLEQAPAAMKSVRDLPEGTVGGSDGFVVFVVETDMHKGPFPSGVIGLSVPAMAERPVDVAEYARRFARISADRMGKPKCVEFSEEAIYAILAFEWPGNYRQIQTAISQAVMESDDAALGLPALASVMGGQSQPTPVAEKRLPQLLKNAQNAYLKEALRASGRDISEMARDLKLNAVPKSVGELEKIPLIKPELGQF